MAEKAIKGQTLTNFMATHLVLYDSPLAIDLLDEKVMIIVPHKGWEKYLAGASSSPQEKEKKAHKIMCSKSELYSFSQKLHLSYTPSYSQMDVQEHGRS